MTTTSVENRDSTLPNQFEQSPRREVAPSVTLEEIQDGYIMRVGLPGVDESDLHLTVEDRTLSIEADTRYETPQGYRLIREECPPVRYKGVYEIPDLVKADGINAKLSSDGVLRIELPKREEVKPRKIAVSAG